MGEENALREWNLTYFNQAQLYMYYSGIERHYLTATTPGCRDDMKCITFYQEDVAKALVEKAEEVIFSTERPTPISTAPEKSFACKFCNYKEYCMDQEFVTRNCRTCVHSEPSVDGDALWNCNFHNKKLEHPRSIKRMLRSTLSSLACAPRRHIRRRHGANTAN